MIKKLSLLILLFLLSFLATGSVEAAWSDPKKISTSSNTGVMPSITTDAKGYLHAVWMELSPSDYEFWSGRENPGIYYSKWNGDTWSAPLKISQNTGRWAGLPSIGADSQNRLHVVWDEMFYNSNDNEEGQIMYSMYDGISWSMPVSISSATEGTDKWNLSARIAVDASDIVHVIYNYKGHGDVYSLFEYYYTKKNGGSWTTPEKISEDFDVQHAAFAVGPGSTVNVALWNLMGSPGKEIGIWYKRYNGTSWSQAVHLSGNEDAQYPKMVVDGTGRIHLIWTNILSEVRYTTSTDGISWSTPVTLTSQVEGSYWGLPLLGLTKDSKNNVYAGWGEKAASGVDIKYRKCGSNCSSLASWGSSITIRNVVEVDSPFIYQDVWDNQHFIWTELNQSGLWEIWYSIAAGYWATIGSGGGSLTVNPNNVTFVTLTIPLGALAGNTDISIAIGPLPESANPNYVTIPRSYYFGPSGQTFSKNFTTVYTYTTAELNGGDPRNLGVYVWNGQTNSWNYQTGTVNTTQKTVTIKTNHFSLYGVMAPKVNLSFLSPGETVSGSTVPVSFDMTNAPDGSAVLPVIDGLEDPGPESNVVLLLKDSSGNTVRTVYSAGWSADGAFSVNGANYQVVLSTANLTEGDYTLELMLGGILLGSKKIHIVPIPPSVTTEFLPPLSLGEIYSMIDGSTVPVKFSLYQDTTLLKEKQDVAIKVDDISTKFVTGEGSSDIRFDTVNGQYILNLHTKELNLGVSSHAIRVLVSGWEVDDKGFELIEGGKAKGQNK